MWDITKNRLEFGGLDLIFRVTAVEKLKNHSGVISVFSKNTVIVINSKFYDLNYLLPLTHFIILGDRSVEKQRFKAYCHQYCRYFVVSCCYTIVGFKQYESMSIQIYRKFHLQNLKIFRK